MEEYADHSKRAAIIYVDHPIFDKELDQIESRRGLIAEEVPV